MILQKIANVNCTSRRRNGENINGVLGFLRVLVSIVIKQEKGKKMQSN